MYHKCRSRHFIRTSSQEVQQSGTLITEDETRQRRMKATRTAKDKKGTKSLSSELNMEMKN